MALVLSRKNKQTVIIDGCVTITVLSSCNVKLAIDAPDGVHVLRGELQNKEIADDRLELAG